MRAQQPTEAEDDADFDLKDLLQLRARNEAKDNEQCISVPLEDMLRGPGHVAWKLIQSVKENPQNPFEFNEEQIDCIALHCRYGPWNKLGGCISKASRAHARRLPPCASCLVI